MGRMIELSAETEALATKIAQQNGQTLDEVVHDAIITRAIGAGIAHRKRKLTPAEKFVAIDALSHLHAERPTYDPRSIDEIINYDEFGLPR
jgi:hypothetical protein